MDATQIVDAACANKDTLTQVLVWAGGTMPVVSAVTWATARWGKLPPGLQTLLQVAAGNVLHAILGEPTATSSVLAPPPPPSPAPNNGAPPLT